MPILPEVIYNLTSDASRLNDFTAYLSKNHCLETFQFIQDALRYQAHYAEIVEHEEIPWEYLRRHYDYLQELWEDLLGTYILPNGHREVNLPSEIRTRLLGIRSSALPPYPSGLDDAVKTVLELMEHSILPGFMKSYESLDQPGGGGEFSADFGGKSQRLHQNGITKTLCHGFPIRERIVRPLIVPAAAS
jgi:hypothetical protein